MGTQKVVVDAALGRALGIKPGAQVTLAGLERKVKRHTKGLLVSEQLSPVLEIELGDPTPFREVMRKAKALTMPRVVKGQKWKYTAEGYPKGQWLRVTGVDADSGQVQFQWYGEGPTSTMTMGHLRDHGRKC